MMRWPWRKTEERGSYTDTVVRMLEAEAAGTAADTASTAAVEAASGSLSRAFCAAKVTGADHAVQAITPAFLAQVGRDLIRSGSSMHVVTVDQNGRVFLVPANAWTIMGGSDPASWSVEVSTSGPSTSDTRKMPYNGVVFMKWGSAPGQPFAGKGPLSWASTTSSLQSETERSLADEMKGPLAQLITVPKDGGDGSMDQLKADLKAARGRVALCETTQLGYGEGRLAAPQKDFSPTRLGPSAPPTSVQIRKDTFDAVLSACGTPPALFSGTASGTAAREAMRRYHLGTVLPLAKLLEYELRDKLDAPGLKLIFDRYPLDLAGRAQAFQKLVAGGVSVTEALATSGLLADGET